MIIMHVIRFDYRRLNQRCVHLVRFVTFGTGSGDKIHIFYKEFGISF